MLRIFPVLFALTIAACGDDDHPAPSATPHVPTPEAPPAPETPPPAPPPMRAEPRVLSFEREGATFLSGVDASAPRRAIDRAIVDLSPDAKLATVDLNEGDSRRVGLYDLTTNAVTPLRGVPEANAYDARFSSNGRSVIFQVMVNGRWNVGLVRLDGTGFRPFTISDGDCYSATFAASGDAFYCHDLHGLYLVGLDGVIRWRARYDALVGPELHALPSSGLTVTQSSDGRYVAFDVAIEHAGLPDGASAVFVHDLASASTLRVSPPELGASNPSWMDASHLVFDAVELTPENLRAAASDRPVRHDLYRVGVDGTGRERVIEGASRPRFSAP